RPDTRPDDGAATASPVGVRDVGPGWPPTPPRHDAQTAGPDGPGKPPGRRSGGLRLALLAAFFVAVGARFGWSALVIIAGLLVMIFLHELGHYVTARWSGMKVTEFFIGFGPKISAVRRGATEYRVEAVPHGAYDRIIGSNNPDYVAPPAVTRT